MSSLLRDPNDGSRWARGSGGNWSYPFLQELTPAEADALEAASYVPIDTYARDAQGRLWWSRQAPLEHAIALQFIPEANWRSLEPILQHYPGLIGYQVVDLPHGWGRITRLPFDGSSKHVLVESVEGDGTDAFYQRWPDGKEIPS